ncbi:MAG: hypothetical protein ACRDHZ_21570 [Ktedonobacteraceae bacterium]
MQNTSLLSLESEEKRMNYALRTHTVTLDNWFALSAQWASEGGTISGQITFDVAGHIQRHVIDHTTQVHVIYTLSDVPPREPFEERFLQIQSLLVCYLTLYHRSQDLYRAEKEGMRAIDLAKQVLAFPHVCTDPADEWFMWRLEWGFESEQLWFVDITPERLSSFIAILAESRYSVRSITSICKGVS